MSPRPQPDVLARLRAANPVAVQTARGHSEPAQTTLQRILEDHAGAYERGPAAPGARRDRRRSSRGLAVVLALLLLGGGAAFAATDPLGWWSANPGEARYGTNPALRVRTPTIQEIGCRAESSGSFRCTAGHSGRRYTLVNSIEPPIKLTRAIFAAGITRARGAGAISSVEAAQFRADLAAVPDSFFRELELGSRFGTYGGAVDVRHGRTFVPPPGVPGFLVCERAGSALSCQDLNGDHAAPIGAGVYSAVPADDWRPASPTHQSYGLPPGITFTPAEYRLLRDMIEHARGTSSSSSGSAAAPRAAPTARQHRPR